MIHYLKDNVVDEEILQTLRALPVWPCHKNHFRLSISAEMGKCCHQSAMLMPWIKNLADFISPAVVKKERESLLALGCKMMTIQEVWKCVEDGFPKSLDMDCSEDYCNLLKTIDGANLVINVKIAPNGQGNFCHPSALYDYSDAIFRAAFRRKEAQFFLHKDLRGKELATFWKSRGLRTRSDSANISGKDFLLCAREIQHRLWNVMNSKDILDAAKVAKYLCWDRPCLHNWTDDTWEDLSFIKIFAVADDLSNQLAYRRPRMQELAQEQSHCSLRQLGRETDRRIIWSQKLFAKNMPAPVAFEKIAGSCFSTVYRVVDHLKYLIGAHKTVSSTELAEYLRDIQASYTYLQDHAVETSQIHDIRSAEIWINLDISDVDKIKIDDVPSAICPARLLCMNCPSDPLPLKVARKFLVPYERLLTALGCPSVVQPPKEPKRASGNNNNNNTTGGLPMIPAMKQIQIFRQEGTFVDIIFQAEGRNKPAHKVFMAAVSNYCRAQFTGPWGKLPRDNHKTEVIKLDDIKFKTVSQMVDFAYTGEVNFSIVMDRANNDEIAERLDDLLDLLRGTDRWLLKYMHQLTEDHVVDYSDL